MDIWAFVFGKYNILVVVGRLHCVKHARIRIFSDPCFPVSLYGKILFKENPYFGIIFEVLVILLIQNNTQITRSISPWKVLWRCCTLYRYCCIIKVVSCKTLSSGGYRRFKRQVVILKNGHTDFQETFLQRLFWHKTEWSNT